MISLFSLRNKGTELCIFTFKNRAVALYHSGGSNHRIFVRERERERERERLKQTFAPPPPLKYLRKSLIVKARSFGRGNRIIVSSLSPEFRIGMHEDLHVQTKYTVLSQNNFCFFFFQFLHNLLTCFTFLQNFHAYRKLPRIQETRACLIRVEELRQFTNQLK